MAILKKSKKEEIKKTDESKKESVNLKTFNPFLFSAIRHPRITEKTHNLAKYRQYAFNIRKDANKKEIIKAVEKIYGVEVEKVRIINSPDKKKRLGRSVGIKSGPKKAIVTLKVGQSIEIMPQ